MNLLDLTERRLKAFLDRVDALRANHFPQQDAEDVLADIGDRFEAHLAILARIRADPQYTESVVVNECAASLAEVFRYLPFLGFLHRSKSTHNALELHAPFQRMAQQLLGRPMRLVLSSEWSYSPFIHRSVPGLSSAIVLGFPACESTNALLAPLAGHEFGHALWAQEDMMSSVAPILTSRFIDRLNQLIRSHPDLIPEVRPGTDLEQDLDAAKVWHATYVGALRQAEEAFCDCVGMLLFGPSFVYAFAHLLAPYIPGPRTAYYPEAKRRMWYLTQVAKDREWPLWAPAVDLVRDTKSEIPERDLRLVEVADAAVDDIWTTNIYPAALALVERRKMMAEIETSVGTQQIVARFKLVAPPETPKNLPSILQAAWIVERDPNFWATNPEIMVKRTDVINHLVRKSAQVLEVNRRRTLL